MAGSDSYGQNVPYPKLNDVPNAETGFGSMANALAALSNMTFANANARASTLTTPVVGMETYLVAEGRKEYYDGTQWTTITPGQWKPIPFASGYVALSGSPSYRIVNGMVQMRGTGQRSNGAPLVPMSQLHVVTNLPAEARPTGSRWFAVATEWTNSIYARLEVNADGTMNLIVPEQTGTAPSWFGLDGVSFSLT